MASLPIAQWQAALDRMEASLLSATRSLDRAEERWELAAAPSAGEGEPPAALDRLDARLSEWEERVRAAAGLTAGAEVELAQRAGAVERWRALFVKWQELLERPGHTS
jgi:hypothetical protein